MDAIRDAYRALSNYPTYEDTEEGRNLEAFLSDLHEVARVELEEMAARFCAATSELLDNPNQPFSKMEQEVLEELKHKLRCRLNI